MRSRFTIAAIVLSCLATQQMLVSCAGYHLEGRRPQALTRVKHIRVPLFENKTLIPRGETLATNSVIDAIASDGTYRIANESSADAVLQGTVESITYNQISAARLDTLRSEELENTITLRWELRDAKNPLRILAKGRATGTSRFAVDANLQTARSSALPDAMQRAATQVVGRLTDDY
ncbi:MAG: hypothetical protein RLZZ553_1374 [Verrucomicrobiota bacterium]